MGRELFLDFFTEHEVPVIRKRRHEEHVLGKKTCAEKLLVKRI